MSKIRIWPSDTKEKMENGNSVIILHEFPRTSKAPNVSPYPLKLETFLRMNKLEYVSDFKKVFGPKGKSPWITDTAGQAIGDTEFIIEHLIAQHDIQGPKTEKLFTFLLDLK